jgi:hypothetical protein
LRNFSKEIANFCAKIRKLFEISGYWECTTRKNECEKYVLKANVKGLETDPEKARSHISAIYDNWGEHLYCLQIACKMFAKHIPDTQI